MSAGKPSQDEGPPPRSRGRSAARRRALLDAARCAIRAHGPDVSMEQIAAEASVSRPILYRHFGSREGMAQAVAHDAIADFMGESVQAGHVPRVPAIIEGSGLRETLLELVRQYLDFVDYDPELYRFILRERAFRRISQEGDRAEGPLGLIILPLVTALALEGLSEIEANWQAHLLAGVLAAAVGWNVETRGFDRPELERRMLALCEQVVDLPNE
jgi:AcrR family transcriptional regulator